MGETRFGRMIRTSGGAQPLFPAVLESVEQSIDCVQELPPLKLRLGHWRNASLLLWSALDNPGDSNRLAAADAALCAALASEGWLDESPPS